MNEVNPSDIEVETQAHQVPWEEQFEDHENVSIAEQSTNADLSTAFASPGGRPKQRDAAASIGYVKWIVRD